MLGAVAERNRGARGTGPRGAADPVNIGLRHFGKLEIDDMGDAINIVATIARARPARNASSERSLWLWLLLP